MALASRNPIPSAPGGMKTGTVPGSTEAQAYNVPSTSGWQNTNPSAGTGQDWASVYEAQGLYGGRGKPGGATTPTADMSLPSQNAPMESYTWQTGGAGGAGGGSLSGGGGPMPPNTGRAGGAISGLQAAGPASSASAGGGGGDSGLSMGGISFGTSGQYAGGNMAMSSPDAAAPTESPAMTGLQAQQPDQTEAAIFKPGIGGLVPNLGQRLPPPAISTLKALTY